MRCPKCGFISFDYLVSCKRCGSDQGSVKGLIGLVGVQPSESGVLLQSSGAVGLEEQEPDFEFSEGEALEEDEFQFEEASDDIVSPVADFEEMDLDDGDDAIFDLKDDDELQEIQLDVTGIEEELTFEPELDMSSAGENEDEMEFDLDLSLDEAGAEAVEEAGTVDASLADDLPEDPEFSGISEKDISELEIDQPVAVPEDNILEDAFALQETEDTIPLEDERALKGQKPESGFQDGERFFEPDLDVEGDRSSPIDAAVPELFPETEASERELKTGDQGEQPADDIEPLSIDDEALDELDLNWETESEPLIDEGVEAVSTESSEPADDSEKDASPSDNPSALKAESPLDPSTDINSIDEIFEIGDDGAETIEDLSLEELGKDEIFSGTDLKKTENNLSELDDQIPIDDDITVLDLEEDESDLEELAKEFENGLKELEMEDNSELDMSDDAVLQAIPDPDKPSQP